MTAMARATIGRGAVPYAYWWLLRLDGTPKMVSAGLDLYGTHEVPGDGDNPEIIAWAKEVGLERTYRDDLTPWCGLFMAVVASRAGKPVPANPLWAHNWAQFGAASPDPSLGDVLVFQREGGGHVGLYVAEDEGAYHVLGGNQSDQVSIARVARARMVAVRRPKYTVAPAAVRPYIVRAGGALSTNES